MSSQPATPAFLPWTPLRIRITSGLLIAILVSAMDASIVSTAMPTIARDLGGFALYPWVFAGYLLTGTTTVPLWGRLADLFGRRRVLLAGLAWFVAASLLCAVSPGMAWLVAFRTLQGVGAGCLQPVTLTMVGDLFPIAQRARLQGLFSSAWAVAALIGPLLGAVFVSTVGWRWVFGVNLPIGIVAAVLLWASHDQGTATGRGDLDLVGAATLTLGVGAFLAGLGAGNGAQPVWPLVGAGLLLLAAFALAERRARHPVLPVDLLRTRLVGPASLAALLAGGLMFALSAFIPLYVQGALGGSALAAGAALTPSSVGWSVGAVFSGRVLLRIGYQRLVVAGAMSMVVGTALLLVHPPVAGPVWVGIAAAIVGIGMGQLQTPILIVLQSSVGWGRRGAVTALNQFSRTIGGAVGVSLLGMLLEWRVHQDAVARGVNPALVRNPLQQAGAVGTAVRPLLEMGLREGVFVALAVVAVATMATALAILWLHRSDQPGAS